MYTNGPASGICQNYCQNQGAGNCIKVEEDTGNSCTNINAGETAQMSCDTDGKNFGSGSDLICTCSGAAATQSPTQSPTTQSPTQSPTEAPTTQSPTESPTTQLLQHRVLPPVRRAQSLQARLVAIRRGMELRLAPAVTSTPT